jgi:hypothetical protein
MTDWVTKVKFWRRGIIAWSAAGVVALAVHGCVTTPPSVPSGGKSERSPDHFDCAAEEEVESLLVELVTTAALAYGRIDPLLYEVDSNGRIQFASRAIPTDAAATERASYLLRVVNANRLAQATLRNNIARSQEACVRDRCPNAVYEVRELERQTDGNDPTREITTYSVGGGAPPSDGERNAFLILMRSDDGRCKPVTDVRFEGNKLVVLTKKPPCDVPDCHAANDGDIGNPCCTTHVAKGTWGNDNSIPHHLQHCCE